MMMNPEMRDLIARSPFTQATVREVAAMLPEDDTALDALIGETVGRNDELEFIEVVQAALVKERPVSARHLARGTMLLQSKWLLGAFACHMEGDVAAPLVAAILETRLPAELLPTALYLAARFHVDQRGGKLPGSLVAAARTAARNKQNEVYERAMLHAVALLSDDAGLASLVLESAGFKRGDPRIPGAEQGSQALAEQMMVIWRKDPFDLVPAAERRTLAEGNTMRRAVARVGRNEKCPCGSGRKYKQCCIEKDAELLRHSTSIAGVTDIELRANPERFLTTVDLDTTEGHEVARYDPQKIEPSLRIAYLACLCRAKLFDRAVEAMEIFGYTLEIEEAWDNISIRIAQARRKDLVDRMLKLRPDAAEHRVGTLTMFLNEHDPAKLMDLLTHTAMLYLHDETDPIQVVGFARSLLKSPLCAIGIMITRGLLPTLPRAEASGLLQELLETRDKLSLSPDDPISDVMDQRFLEQRSGASKEAAALRDLQQRLNDKLQETRRYKENVDRLEKELSRRIQIAASPAPATPAVMVANAPAVDETALQELRQKVCELRSALTERHQERNALRRDLQQAHAALDTLRQKATTVPAAHEEADHEEDLLLPQEAESNQPVRTIEFPKDFRAVLLSLPKSVARGTMTMLGRLAAGDPAAFVGAVRLKACPSITRQRIGIDFRLLFKLLPDRVQVVDLIPRQDLERRIKTLV